MAVYSKENANMHIPKVKGNDWKKILKRYNPSSLEVDFIRQILTYDTKQRLTPFNALKHEYFADLVDCEEAGGLPNLL
jgi:serine/threonine protein kinase